MSKIGVREMGLCGVLLLALPKCAPRVASSAVSLGDASLAVVYLARLYFGRAL